MTIEEAIRLISDTVGTELSLDHATESSPALIGAIHGRKVYGPRGKESVMALVSALSIDTEADPFMQKSKQWHTALNDVSAKLPQQPALPSRGRLLALTPILPESLSMLLDVLSMQLAAKPLYYEDHFMLTIVPEDEQLKDGVLALSETLFFEIDGYANIYLSQAIDEPEAIREAHESIRMMHSAAQRGLIHTPAFFEDISTSLLLHEWLSAPPGPVSRALLSSSLLLTLDEELEKTAEMLFKMNLNLTDAAKALFIHRNTLIYRLDKIHKQIGLDLRLFEDAFQLKLILLLIRHHKTL